MISPLSTVLNKYKQLCVLNEGWGGVVVAVLQGGSVCGLCDFNLT